VTGGAGGSGLVRVQGSHEEVGRQIGEACADAIRRATTFTTEQLPAGRSLEEQLDLSDEYRAVTVEKLPWVVVELDAAADAAGVDRRAMFAASIEEIWPGRDTTARVPGPAFKGCTDIAAAAPATGAPGTLVAHNNDLPLSLQRDVVAVEWRVEGQPTVFSLGIGPWLSTAWNSEGLNITGDELAPNDQRVGVPRLLLMSAVARARTFDEAKAIAAHDARASSYNWVLADAFGDVVSLEGSATATAEIGLDARGLMHHENHYVHPRMQGYERNAAHAERSATRERRVEALISELEPGSLTPELLRKVLSDHENAPESICRHGVGEHDMHTVFWVVADLARREVQYGLGPPCETEPELYRFA
jgi:isopenicillin-N N-acyltransferase-like protein